MGYSGGSCRVGAGRRQASAWVGSTRGSALAACERWSAGWEPPTVPPTPPRAHTSTEGAGVSVPGWRAGRLHPCPRTGAGRCHTRRLCGRARSSPLARPRRRVSCRGRWGAGCSRVGGALPAQAAGQRAAGWPVAHKLIPPHLPRCSYSPVCTDPATIRRGVEEGRRMVQPVARALLEGQAAAGQRLAAAEGLLL